MLAEEREFFQKHPVSPSKMTEEQLESWKLKIEIHVVDWVGNGLLLPLFPSQPNIRDEPDNQVDHQHHNNQLGKADNRRKWKWRVWAKINWEGKGGGDGRASKEAAGHVGQGCRLPHQDRRFQGAKVFGENIARGATDPGYWVQNL